jgi:hypothetical protein
MAMSRSAARASLTTLPPISDGRPGDRLQPGDHAQQRGLAAAGRADEHHEFAIGMSWLMPWMT